jgi:uncharacterized membrane protein YphA (DoxX/SURF4 family)
MERHVGLEVVAVVIRVGLGLWFAISGISKVFFTGLDQFTRDVAAYRMVVQPLDAVVAYVVPWVEIVAGLCLAVGVMRRGAIVCIAGLVAMFAAAVGWAWMQGIEGIDCGCYGRGVALVYWKKALELSGYAVALAWLWWAESWRSGNRGTAAPETSQELPGTAHRG